MTHKIVIVDDSTFAQTLLQDFFQATLGCEVVALGSNGVHAVQLYRKHRPDLMTLDLTMPVKDGKEALEEILTEFPDARIILVSAVTDSSILECMKLGAKGYIEKPLRLDNEDFRKEFASVVAEAFVTAH